MIEVVAALKFLAPIGAALGAVACGASLYLTGIVGPLAFQLFDYSRADRFNRMAIRSGHMKVAGLALGGATLALLGGAVGGAVSMALSATGFMLARFVVMPQSATAVAGGARVHPRGKKKKRVAALASTAIFLPPLMAGIVMALYGV
ncbi:MAG: hypothetical protein ABWZ40_04210 [Caulobacterales bacterium]